MVEAPRLPSLVLTASLCVLLLLLLLLLLLILLIFETRVYISPFPVKRLVQVRGLEPRIDSPSWSFTAWVQLEKGKGANILRKPLGMRALCGV